MLLAELGYLPNLGLGPRELCCCCWCCCCCWLLVLDQLRQHLGACALSAHGGSSDGAAAVVVELLRSGIELLDGGGRAIGDVLLDCRPGVAVLLAERCYQPNLGLGPWLLHQLRCCAEGFLLEHVVPVLA